MKEYISGNCIGSGGVTDQGAVRHMGVGRDTAGESRKVDGMARLVERSRNTYHYGDDSKGSLPIVGRAHQGKEPADGFRRHFRYVIY